MSLGVRVIATDLDVVFSRNPFLLLGQPGLADLDFFIQSEDADHTLGTVNTGFYCISPTSLGKHLLTLWLQDTSLWEQKAMQAILRRGDTLELKWAALPKTVVLSLCHLEFFQEGFKPHYAARFEGTLGRAWRCAQRYNHDPFCLLRQSRSQRGFGKLGAFLDFSAASFSRFRFDLSCEDQTPSEGARNVNLSSLSVNFVLMMLSWSQSLYQAVLLATVCAVAIITGNQLHQEQSLLMSL